LRIAVVNAFSLPSFTGGATIQAHRVARELGARGHEVAVFSGARRPLERALHAREDEVDGVAVTSVNTEPFLGAADRRSYRNRQVDAAVLAWLERVRPDVIHVHSLQGVGAGWFDSARDLAPLVLTMHDWWWLCARQFLVREDLSIDAPLVDVEACDCAGGVEYSRERRAWLAERLAAVDRVLVPSERMRESLVANGLDPARVVANRNGIDAAFLDGAAGAAEAPPADVGFFGGGHELKGLPLLRDALAGAPAAAAPVIHCWGSGIDAAGLPAGFVVHGELPPSEVPGALDGLGGVVVPSLMRESFSLVVHEALARGLAVLCSDSCGPEEVVTHGLNGLVVESGSVPAWRAALARWMSDARLREALAAGARASTGAAVPVSTQVDELEAVFADLATATPAPAARVPALAPPRLLIVCGIEGAPLRYRAHHLAEAHRRLGGTAACVHYRDPGVLDRVGPGDLVVFYRVPWSAWVRRCVAGARAAGAAVVFSVDDLIIDPSLRERIPAVSILSRHEAELWMEGVRRYQAMARACGVLLASTPEIARAGEAMGLRAHTWPNGFSTEMAQLSQLALARSSADRAERAAAGRVRVGYVSGSPTHDRDWALVEAAAEAVLTRRPEVELWLLGAVPAPTFEARFPGRVRRVPTRPFQELPRVMAELDVVLAPLEPGLEFSEAKSAIKWTEAALLGLPVIASPTEPFREAIDDGVTGFLAGPGDWEAALDRVCGDPDLRRRVGLEARRAVYRAQGPAAQAARWADLLPQLVAAAQEEAGRDLPAGVPVEANAPWALEPEASRLYLDQRPSPGDAIIERLGGARRVAALLSPSYPNLARVDFYAAFAQEQPEGAAVELRLVDERATTVRQTAIPPAAVADDGWTAWEFEPVRESAGRAFRFELRQPGAAQGKGVACWTSLETGTREVDGAPQPGGLRVRCFALRDREAACAVAVSRPPQPPPARRSAAARALLRRYHRARVLVYKGRLSLRTEGPVATAARAVRVLQRGWSIRRS